MTFKELMDLYDDWNGITKVNDKDLHKIIQGETQEIMFDNGMLYNKELMNADVESFGFYDNELCVRLNI